MLDVRVVYRHEPETQFMEPRPAERSTPGVVCIVDDDAAVCRALVRLVRSIGLCAEAYTSPVGLLEQKDGASIDCLLLDVQLPSMSGFELNERLVATGRGAPVVFITANLDERTRTRAAAVGAAACLEKPFDEREMLAAIGRVLDLRL